MLTLLHVNILAVVGVDGESEFTAASQSQQRRFLSVGFGFRSSWIIVISVSQVH